MRVSIIGAGYVGLVTGVCLADKGHQVVCVDVDRSKVDRLNRAEAPIHEVGLVDLLERHAGKGFSATTNLAGAVRDSEVTFIAVGTPFDGAAIDLTYVVNAARQVGAALAEKSEHTVVVKSTVVPGTTDGVVREALEETSGRHVGEGFGLGVNPEFLTEGQAVADFMEPDRIVVGGVDERTLDTLSDVYADFTGVPIIRTNNKAAEMIKYASNALLATMISFSNELADLCTALGGVDARDVMAGLHTSGYLTVPGSDGESNRAPIVSFLEAGCGFGGSCLPKDVSALIAHGALTGVEMRVLQAVLDTNRDRPDRVLEGIRREVRDLHDARVAVLGLAFKPDTDDVRESPAFPIIERLVTAGADVTAYDPVAMDTARLALGETPVKYAASLEDAVTSADIIVIVTRWHEFERLPELLRKLDRAPFVFDGRRMLDENSVERYAGIGR
ncbi:MAG: UDP-glucose/GDP-mannose dehydrogenase family protein [Acidimicrobiia bacterium]|jgi:UDPglucose 6-dehydrogenase